MKAIITELPVTFYCSSMFALANGAAMSKRSLLNASIKLLHLPILEIDILAPLHADRVHPHAVILELKQKTLGLSAENALW